MSEAAETIRVLLADDHPALRQGLRTFLEHAPDIQVVGEAEDGWEVQAAVARLRPDVLVLDLVMPGPRPADLERWVRTHYPETVTLVLTAHDRDHYLAQVIEAGAAGFFDKGTPQHQLLDAIRAAAQGSTLLTGEQLSRAARWRATTGERWKRLTERERQVLALLARGYSTRQLATTLGIGERTVETHIGNILSKLALASRAEAVAWVWEQGLVDELDPPAPVARSGEEW